MILDTILKIIPIILSIPACVLAVKSLKACNEIRCKLEDPKNEKIENPEDILYSMEFNTALDGRIQSLLGKYSNDKIVEIIINQMYGSNLYTQIPTPILEEHVRETLRNYQNSYNEKALEKFVDRDDSLDTFRYTMMAKDYYHINDDMIDEPVEERPKGKSGVSPAHDLSNVLNNFYKD